MKMKRFALGALWTNCYVVWDEKGNGIIVDPGGPAEEVEEFVKKNDLHIHWIILTHGHGDHLGGVADVRNLSEHGVAIHEEDAASLTSAKSNLSAYMGQTVEFAAADRLLTDGDELKVGSLLVKVIHTPGHTLGGIGLLVCEGSDMIYLSGDTLFARSIGRTDLPGGDEDTLLASLKKLESIPDTVKVFPGHGPETTIGEEKNYNPYWPR